MRARRRRTDESVSFQITPMIDLTFLLLIFFMVTTKLSKEQLKMDIRLPVASAAVKPDDLNNRDIVNIDAEGRHFVGETAVTPEELRAYLVERLRRNPPLRIYVRADRDTPARLLRELVDMAADAGAVEVLVGTFQRGGGGE